MPNRPIPRYEDDAKPGENPFDWIVRAAQARRISQVVNRQTRDAEERERSLAAWRALREDELDRELTRRGRG